jgi:peptidoglycan/xylan/chitin deacetylase (PgdA/CDA1 family)
VPLRSFRYLLPLALVAIGLAAPVSAAEPTRVSVLVYHRFDPSVPGPTTVRTSIFAEQLAWLAAHRIPVVPLRALVDGLRRGQLPQQGPAVVLTADDGHRSVYTDMYPLILRYRVPVTLFIYPSAISNADYALTWQQLVEMRASGLVDIQSHTYWHPDFRVEARRLSSAAYQAFVQRQLALSKQRLEARLGTAVDLLAWPFGIYDAFLEPLAAGSGYVAAFTIEPGERGEAGTAVGVGDDVSRQCQEVIAEPDRPVLGAARDAPP